MSSTTVLAITCPDCHYTIFSRARHDMRSCHCGNIAIDGGFDYCKTSRLAGNPDAAFPNAFQITVQATKRELFDDWNYHDDKWGLFEPDCILTRVEQPL